jgi:hypothetical protein
MRYRIWISGLGTQAFQFKEKTVAIEAVQTFMSSQGIEVSLEDPRNGHILFKTIDDRLQASIDRDTTPEERVVLDQIIPMSHARQTAYDTNMIELWEDLDIAVQALYTKLSALHQQDTRPYISFHLPKD